ncbi:MAG TPA: hypothetical protein VFQ95_02990 [Rhodanobacteraceae bacterium]|nr:hypothetical protein [Rhodanobacteraceae bacterium]
MHKYDPEQTPDAAEWLSLDEQERIELAEAYHRKARVEVPRIKIHAVIHAVVENQIAEGHDPVIRAMSRLRAAGLSRHEALHAVGSVLAEHLFTLPRDGSPSPGTPPMAAYDAAIERLTAESWLRG